MKDDGGRAFPLSRENEGWFEPGMTLRDWFAGQALMGLLSYGGMGDLERAAQAYRLADAMLHARALGGIVP